MRLNELVVVTSCALMAITGCKTGELPSVWAGSGIRIDGSQDDWTSGMVFVKEQNIAIGIANDAEKLYLSLTFSDPRTITRVVMSGFTIWVDGKGGTRERLGVRFPLPNQAMMSRPMERGNRRELPGEFPSVERMQSLLDAQLNIELAGTRKEDIHWLPRNNDQGIELALVFGADGRLIYELSMPLTSTKAYRYASDAKPGDKIGIGIKMATPERSRMDRGGGSMGMGDDLPGGMGGGRGGRGGRGGMIGGNMGGRGGGRGQFEPLEYWAKVKLATTPTK
ncbi:hypothetical protein ACFL6E_03695 [Candidatus Neomarinimicrobiota bacterium]